MVTLRILTNPGDVTKGSPLTNAEIDANFIALSTNPKFNGTQGLKLPAGTTLERSGTPLTGEIRFNTELASSEIFNGVEWSSVGGSDVFAKTIALVSL